MLPQRRDAVRDHARRHDRAPLPLLWRRTDCVAALSNPRTRHRDLRPGGGLRSRRACAEVAAELLPIRAVLRIRCAPLTVVRFDDLLSAADEHPIDPVSGYACALFAR
jgi:hypothetical protein